MLIQKIVSGGQTGVDRGALEAAVEAHVPYGGIVPKGRRAEDGIVPPVFDQMTEDTQSNYQSRTELNVIHSDATLILNRTAELTGGTKETEAYCIQHKKPYWIENPEKPRETDQRLDVLEGLEAVFHEKVIVLNVAGPRESKDPGIQAATHAYILRLLTEHFQSPYLTKAGRF